MGRQALLIITFALALVVWLEWQTHEPGSRPNPIPLSDVLGSSPESNDFERVTGPDDLRFPDDHASHDGYRNEWWYFTGNLENAEGRRFGFQYTLFRFKLGSRVSTGTAWDSEQLWMAHFAISDLDNERFYSEERFARDALELAGATEQRWWLGPWQVERTDEGWQLRALAQHMGLDIRLTPDRPKVLQGERGFSQKGPEPGQASRYYSHTRLAAAGSLSLDDWSGEVTGQAWLDREWGSGQLDESLAGWDWFALHLDDGRDLMVYRLRKLDGRASEFSAGSLVWPDGHYEILNQDDFAARAGRGWRDETGVTWPLSWEIDLPSHDIELVVEAAFDDQRWRASVPYWEGMVKVSDRRSGQTIGRGYMELSGYADTGRDR